VDAAEHPAAPERLSVTIGWPSIPLIRWSTARATRSAEAPGGQATTMAMGREEQAASCATACGVRTPPGAAEQGDPPLPLRHPLVARVPLA